MIGIIMLAVAGGIYWWFNRPEAGEKIPPPKPSLEVVADDTILGWLARGSVECSVTTDAGEVKIMTKKEKIRFEGLPYKFANNNGTTNGILLSVGGWTYMWSGTAGTKLNVTEINKVLTPEQKLKAGDYDWTDTIKAWENSGYKYDCRETKLADELFSVPTDINFNDLTSTYTAIDRIKDTNGNLNAEDIEAELERIEAEKTLTPQ